MRLVERLRRSSGGLPNGREPVVSPQPPLRGGAPRFSMMLVVMLALALPTLAACSSANNKNKAAQPTAGGDILGAATFQPTAASYTPVPASTRVGTPYPVPPGTPPVGEPNPCIGLSSGPQQAGATLPPATPIPAFTPGPQPQRPPIDLGTLKLSAGTIPSDQDPFQDGKFTAVNIVPAMPYPQYAYAFLQTIGFEVGRAETWTGPDVNGRRSLLTVIYYVFDNDAGASAFLQHPLFPANFCTKSEQGAMIGMETAHFSYQYAAAVSQTSQGIYEGHRVFWRCGRVLLSVEQVGMLGQFSAASTDAIAQKVQSDYLETQSCS